MRYKGFIKRLAITLVTFCVMFNYVLPVTIFAAQYSGQLGTNKALGSPLLNEGFTFEEWNKWEMVTFGVFLSNFCEPLLDSYETAFTVSNRGSGGAGKKALVFGSGTDSAGMKSLDSLLQYAVPAQKNAAKDIMVQYTTRYFNTGLSDVVGEQRQAKLSDLLINSKLKENEPYVVEANDTFEVDSYSVKQLSSTNLGKFTVKGTGTQDEVIFDLYDGWDLQTLQAWMGKILYSDNLSKINDNLDKMLEADAILKMDCFGNICVSYENDLIVVLPAASNQHLTKTPKYNLVNSITMGGNYTAASQNSLIENIETSKTLTNNYKGGSNINAKGDLKEGDLVVYIDSDTTIYKYFIDNLMTTRSSASNVPANWGMQLVNLMSSNIGKNSSNVGFTIDLVGAENLKILDKWFGGKAKKELADMAKACKMLKGVYSIDPSKDTLVTLTTPKGEAPIFGGPVYVPVNAWVTEKNNGMRRAISSSMKYMDGSTAASSGKLGIDSAATLRAQLSKAVTFEEAGKYMWFSNGNSGAGVVSDNIRNAMAGDCAKLMESTKGIADKAKKGIKYSELSGEGLSLKSKSMFGGDWKDIASDNSERIGSIERILKVYTQNDNMKGAMGVLGVKDGTDFAIWTPHIYMTYLKWYGIIDGKEEFNEHLFSGTSDMLNVKPEELFKGTFLSKEEKEAEVLDYTYLMLHPTEGRQYRSDMMMNWLTDWVYNTYQSMVNGNSVDSYTVGDNVGTRSAAGFLHMESYQDNFTTSWFMQMYSKYAIVLIGIMVVAIVIVGILNQKSFAWFIVSLALMVNIVLITPIIGEITPFVANNTVQSMFDNKMTYWAMAESVANAKLEKEINSSSMDSAQKGAELTTKDFVRMLNVIYLDRSIMLRTDISKKITEDSTGIVNDIQQLQSARWLLPTIIRQFSASDGSANYVYQPVGDVYDSVSNMYWLYKPDDMISVQTANSAGLAIDTTQVPNIALEDKQGRYDGYKDTSMAAERLAEAYVSGDTNPTWNSISREAADEDKPHTGFYILDGLEVPDASGDWESVADAANYTDSEQQQFIDLANQLEMEASKYDPVKEGAKPSFGFLWTTENPMHYFYQSVKDSFTSGRSLAQFSGDLQGYYEQSDLTGEDERISFMHFRDTGYIRDFLDLEELFTNVIPYMYTVQLMAGGNDGDNGILGDAKMNNYPMYEDNNKSWLFRSNWVTKLMEDKDLTRATTVKCDDGSRVKVENPMLPSSYPSTRHMVFSEAEMEMKGLTRADLTIPELKILEVNERVERKWTMLINYVNSPEITTEVFYRQMATDAMLEFNKEFSPDRKINGSKAMYPTSLDLRSISFDSVMKMLMINSTRDASYVYGDTMKQVIANSDILSAILMLVGAFLCAFVIPFIRNVILGLIFFLGLWAVACNILAGGLTKLKITAAYAINNIVYLAVTLAYYAVFMLLINTSTADSVLSVGNVVVNAGPPTWQFIIIVLSSCAYIWASFRLASFTLKNYRDLGFEVYATWSNVLANKLSNSIAGVKDKIGSGNNGSKASSNGGPIGNSAKRSYKNEVYEEADGKRAGAKRKPANISNGSTNSRSGYMTDKVDDRETVGANRFDDEIEKGKHSK